MHIHSGVRVDVLCVEVGVSGHAVIGVGRVIVQRHHALEAVGLKEKFRRTAAFPVNSEDVSVCELVGLEMDKTREISDKTGAERSDLSKVIQKLRINVPETHTCSDAVQNASLPQAPEPRRAETESLQCPHWNARQSTQQRDTTVQTDQEKSKRRSYGRATIAKHTRGSGGTREDRHPSNPITSVPTGHPAQQHAKNAWAQSVSHRHRRNGTGRATQHTSTEGGYRRTKRHRRRGSNGSRTTFERRRLQPCVLSLVPPCACTFRVCVSEALE